MGALSPFLCQRLAGTGAVLGNDGGGDCFSLPVGGEDADLKGGQSEHHVEIVLHASLQFQIVEGGSARQFLTTAIGRDTCLIGDEVLEDISGILTESSGDKDVLMRIGGDEFVGACRTALCRCRPWR